MSGLQTQRRRDRVTRAVVVTAALAVFMVPLAWTALAATPDAASAPPLVSTSAGVSTPEGTPPSVSVTRASWAGPELACAAEPG